MRVSAGVWYNKYMNDTGVKLTLGDIPLSEEDVKHCFITPALERAGWDSLHFRMEYAFTAGRIRLEGNVAHRGACKKADYLLWHRPDTAPLAVIEAKQAKFPVGHGLQQAMDYARLLDVPFAYSSNGQGFAEFDFLTGKTRYFAMDEFPSPQALYARFCAGGPNRPPLDGRQKSLLERPCYYAPQSTKTPRYYQNIAINRTVAAIAAGQNRLLLTLATGTGKTFIAFQIVWRLLRGGICHRVLYLADRNVLVDQTQANDFAPLAKECHKIQVQRDLTRPASVSAFQVYFGLYQQLIDDDGNLTFPALFPPDFFDLVIVDECHRGSANEDSQWRKILDYFSSACQLGMTATPRETRYASNTAYFGEPLYRYSLAQGIDDGFLAPFRVRTVTTNIGDGWRPTAGQRDAFGQPIPDRIYTNADYDTNLVLLDRTREVAQAVTDTLRRSGDPMVKTIVFCPTEEAALRMRNALATLNADLMQDTHGDYVVRITASDKAGLARLDAFASIGEHTPVIAVTSQLLTTGVDTKMVKLIAIDKPIGSMTEFKQIIGRGTRLVEKHGKTAFTLLDFRNVAHLFADPQWDGEPEPDEAFGQGEGGGEGGSTPPPPPPPFPPEPRLPPPVVDASGCPVYVINEHEQLIGQDGKVIEQTPLPVYAKRTILNRWPDFSNFREEWLETEDHAALLAPFVKERGLDLTALRATLTQADCDLYDVIAHLAYDAPLVRSAERAQAARQSQAFTRWKDETCRAVLSCLLDHYESQGPDVLANLAVLKLPAFQRFGSPRAIADRFGGKPAYLAAVRALFHALYKD